MIDRYTLQKELTALTALENKLKNVITGAPKGSIYYRERKNGELKAYWDRYEKGRRLRTPVDPDDAAFLRRMKHKTYAKWFLGVVQRDIRALKEALKYRPITEEMKASGGKPFEECRAYFFGSPLSSERFDRLEERQNPFHPEEMTVKTELGVFRSKLEYIIARILTDLGLRFKYEAPLAVGMTFYYPDFTVLHPKTGKLIFIEAAGMVNREQYRKRQASRIESFAQIGIYLGIDLFVIAESPDGIDTEAIACILRGIFGL